MRGHRRLTLALVILAVLALLVAAVVVLRPFAPGDDGANGNSGPTATGPTGPPDSQTLFLPGYDSSPSSIELTDPATASGSAISTSLALSAGSVDTRGMVGLSFDARELANPMWDDEDSNLELTLEQLRSPALRFGGNGIDRSVWWTSTGEPAPEWAEATVTPKDLQRVAAVAKRVDAQVTIDLDLGHDDPARAADMAAHAQEAFGDNLLAIAIGNEPNGFHHPNQPQLAVRGNSWSTTTYQRSLREYSAALQKATPGIPVAGPDAYDAPWWRAFANSGIPDQRALSLHWYPLWDCDGPASSIANPTIEDLTSPKLRERARHIVDMGAKVADAHDLPLWMEETGPTSCPGTNDTSRTHAQALWTVDYTMTLAELGVERTAFHSTLQACDGGAPMSPICARGPHADPGLIVAGRASYLALSLMSELPRGRVLDSSTSGDGRIAVHGVVGKDGRLGIAIVDMRDPAQQKNSARAVEVSAPSGTEKLAPKGWTLSRASQLDAKSLDASSSTMGALAPVTGALTGATLERAHPLTVASEPGTVTVLELEPTAPEPSDAGG